MKKLLVFAVCCLIASYGYSQSQLPKKFPNISKVKVKEDFPKEGRSTKGGKGFSANLAILPHGIKKVALVSFYAFDPGLTKTWSTSYTVSGPIWDTKYTTTYKKRNSTGALAGDIAFGAFAHSIEPMINEFKSLGIDLLLPNEYLNTPEKKTYYDAFQVNHEKSIVNWLNKLGANDHAYVYGSMEGFIIADIVKEPFMNYEKTGMFATRKNSVTDVQVFLFDKDTKQTESLGYDLCTKLEVDAVLVTYMTIFMPKSDRIELVNVRFQLFGPNPTMPEGESKHGVIPHVKGLFYYGASVNPETIIYDENKKDPESKKLNFAGFDLIYTACVKSFGKYYTSKYKK
ncbi:MAG TPA: hypothetical protein DCQ31_12505 [Bacteroidales bacterium]|nr:hypothetical protein [Bacteroidales bacterium]